MLFQSYPKAQFRTSANLSTELCCDFCLRFFVTAEKPKGLRKRGTSISETLSRMDACTVLKYCDELSESECYNGGECTNSVGGEDVHHAESTENCRSPAKHTINLSLDLSKSNSGVFSRRYSVARRDLRALVGGVIIFKTPMFRNRISEDSLYDAVRFILDDVQVLSWASKTLEVLTTDRDGVEVCKIVFLEKLGIHSSD